MAGPSSRRIVIDADIAQAAGSSENPRSIACREFLETMRDVCHRLATNPESLAEYRTHQSRFFSGWLTSMFARRKVDRMAPSSVKDIREAIESMETSTVSESDRQATLKDLHLIALAFAADRLVASMDETARSCFSKASTEVTRLKRIVWVNPEREVDRPIEWLNDGARDDSSRRLGSRG